MEPTVNLLKAEKAMKNLTRLRVRLVEKLASSTTGAQNHVGLLTQCVKDMEAMGLILDSLKVVEVPPTPKTAPKAKVAPVSKDG